MFHFHFEMMELLEDLIRQELEERKKKEEEEEERKRKEDRTSSSSHFNRFNFKIKKNTKLFIQNVLC
jgi:hypothetical protein